MNKRAVLEFTVVALLVVGLLVSIVPALKYARAEKRDAEALTNLAFTKHVLELYFNKHNTYPLKPVNTQFTYVVTAQDKKGATGWYIETPLEHALPSDHGFDAEAGRNFYYRVVSRSGHLYYQVCGGTELCGAS